MGIFTYKGNEKNQKSLADELYIEGCMTSKKAAQYIKKYLSDKYEIYWEGLALIVNDKNAELEKYKIGAEFLRKKEREQNAKRETEKKKEMKFTNVNYIRQEDELADLVNKGEIGTPLETEKWLKEDKQARKIEPYFLEVIHDKKDKENYENRMLDTMNMLKKETDASKKAELENIVIRYAFQLGYKPEKVLGK